MIALSVCSILLVGCHPKVQPVQDTDSSLTCAQLKSEIEKTEQIKKQIQDKRGFSGRNVGLGLLFWPGVIVNEATGHDAEADANARIAQLRKLYDGKQCSKSSCTLAEAQQDSKKKKG